MFEEIKEIRNNTKTLNNFLISWAENGVAVPDEAVEGIVNRGVLNPFPNYFLLNFSNYAINNGSGTLILTDYLSNVNYFGPITIKFKNFFNLEDFFFFLDGNGTKKMYNSSLDFFKNPFLIEFFINDSLFKSFENFLPFWRENEGDYKNLADYVYGRQQLYGLPIKINYSTKELHVLLSEEIAFGLTPTYGGFTGEPHWSNLRGQFASRPYTTLTNLKIVGVDKNQKKFYTGIKTKKAEVEIIFDFIFGFVINSTFPSTAFLNDGKSQIALRKNEIVVSTRVFSDVGTPMNPTATHFVFCTQRLFKNLTADLAGSIGGLNRKMTFYDLALEAVVNPGAWAPPLYLEAWINGLGLGDWQTPNLFANLPEHAGPFLQYASFPQINSRNFYKIFY